MSIQELLYNKATTQYELLMAPIHLFRLKIQGSKIGRLIREVRKELQKKRLIFKPTFYLSDEFGCVQDTTNIGIPFYMVDPELEELNQCVGSEKNKVLENHQIKALLRHECGHAFFYAYSMAKNQSAKRLFGDFFSKRIPLKNVDMESADYVDYLSHWGAASPGYSRTHPEEDFSDTFAVWLDPRENKNSYRGKALKKLQLVEKMIRCYAGKRPRSLTRELHKPQTTIRETLENFFRRYFGPFNLESFRQRATGYLDHHLLETFSLNPTKISPSAAQFLERNKRWLARQARRWVKNPYWLGHLIEKSIERAKVLKLTVPGGNLRKARKIFSALLVLMTTLLEEKGRLD